jgi:hypothetical protein
MLRLSELLYALTTLAHVEVGFLQPVISFEMQIAYVGVSGVMDLTQPACGV